MSNRKEKSTGVRFLSCISAFLMVVAIGYISIAGINMYAGTMLIASVLGLGVPAISAGEGFMDSILGFFEMFLDGLMEVFGGIGDFIGSFFDF